MKSLPLLLATLLPALFTSEDPFPNATISKNRDVSILVAVADPDCHLPATSDESANVGLGFPRIKFRTSSTGNIKVTVVFVDFSDAPASQAPKEIFAANISPASENFLEAVSYGKLSVVFEPTFKWFRMAKPSTGYEWMTGDFESSRAYINEALGLADPTVDFSSTDAFLIIANPEAKALTNGPAFAANETFGVTFDGNTMYNGVRSGHDMVGWKGLWFVHEFGHTLGLPDLYASSGDPNRFAGQFSVMGLISGAAPELFGWERWNLGWLEDSQVRCVPATGHDTVQLSAIESSDEGTKLLVIKLTATSELVVESRRNFGFDAKLPKSGSLVYIVDTGNETGEGPIKVLPENKKDTKKLQSVLSEGESLTYGGVTIKCVGATEEGDTVEFSMN